MSTYWDKHPLLPILKAAATKHRFQSGEDKAWKKVVACVDEIGPVDPLGTVPMELPREAKGYLSKILNQLEPAERDRLQDGPNWATDVVAREALRALVVEKTFARWGYNDRDVLDGPCPDQLFDHVKGKVAEMSAAMTAWEADRQDTTFDHALVILKALKSIERRLNPDDMIYIE